MFPAFIYTQSAEIVPFAGYMFDGSVNYYEGKLDVQSGLNYGLSVLVPVIPELRQDSIEECGLEK